MNEFFKNNQRQQASKVVNIKEFLSSKDGHKHSVSVNPSVNMINVLSMKQNSLDKTDVDIKEANTSDNRINQLKQQINLLKDGENAKKQEDKKLKLIDETCVGSFDLSSDLKAQFRRYKSRYWAGIRVPLDRD